jgi:hypothetical protein
MNFTPKKESELYTLLEKGEYPFTVVESENAVSKNENEMIKLKVAVYTAESENPRCYIFDYLMESLAAKLRHFCDAAGLLVKYEAGTLSAYDCLNKEGTCRVVIQKDKTGQYSDKNAIADYVCRKAKPLQMGGQVNTDEPPPHTDDLPF